MLEALRPKPFRGDTVAAGAVVLTTLVALLVTRYSWAQGVDVGLLAVTLAFVGTMAVTAPVEGRDPRVYQTVLFVSTLVLLGLGLERVGGGEGSWTLAWKGAVVTAAATWFARRRGSGTCALIAALAGGVAVLALAAAVPDWESDEAIRRELLLLTVVYALAAVVVRDRRPRAAAMLAVAGGTATLGIAVTFALQALPGLFLGALGETFESPEPGTGWLLLLLASGFGLCALSGVERQPGPGYVGVLNLVAFLLLAAGDGSLLGWPLLLAVAAGALLAAGLRPSRPLPPPPVPPGPPAEPLPLRPR